MYSLDVNFLKDRHLDASKATVPTKAAAGPPLKQQLPIIIGGLVLLVLPALAASSLLLLSQLSSQTQQRIAELDAQLGELNAQTQRIKDIEAQIAKSNQEVQSLVGVFNQIKPWSAMFAELGQQTPKNVQIGLIQQDGLNLIIAGYALNYDDLNDFILTLQSSPFLQADKTKLVEAILQDLPVEVQNVSEDVSVSIPQAIKYTITTQLTERPSSELASELARDGAVGLVSRLKTLQQKGVLQP